MSLLHFILRNRAALDNSYKRHVERVFNRGGYIRDEYDTKQTFDRLLMRNLSEYAMVTDPQSLGVKYGATNGQVSEVYSIHQESDLLQTTASAQPLLHEWRGENYWSNQGIAGNYVSTPDAASNRITGDIEIVVKAQLPSWTAGSNESSFITKDGGGSSRAYSFRVQPSGQLNFYASIDGTNAIGGISTAAVPFAANTIGYVKATRSATTGDINYYTSTDGTTWTKLGNTVASTPGNILASSSFVEVGTRLGGTSMPLKGRIFFAKVYNGIGGTLAVNFDTNDYRKTDPTNQTSWVASTTGETWTINTDSAATGYKGVLVDRTMFQTDGTDDNLKTGAMTLNQPVSMYLPVNVLNAGATNRAIYDGLSGANVLRLGSTNRLQLYNGSFLTDGYVFNDYKRTILLSSIHNGVSSSLNKNNTTIVSGNVGLENGGGVIVASNRGNGDFINALFSTIIATRTADNASQQADMNAFINQLHKRLY